MSDPELHAVSSFQPPGSEVWPFLFYETLSHRPPPRKNDAFKALMQGGISLTMSALRWRRLHLPLRVIMLIFIQRQQDGNRKLISDHWAVFLLLKPHNFSVSHAKNWREAFAENVWLLRWSSHSPDSYLHIRLLSHRVNDSSVFTRTAKARADRLSLRNLAACAPPVSLLTFTSVFIFNSDTENAVYHRKM